MLLSSEFFRTKTFKKITLILSVFFFLLSVLSVFNPKILIRFGYPGIFLSHLLGAGSILTFALVKHFNPYLLAILTALGMTLNDSIAYLIGKNSDVVIERPEKIKKIEGTIQKYGPYALFAWALIPFPYDLIGVIAGYLEMPYRKFFLAAFLGKLIRTLLIAFGIITFAHLNLRP